MTPKDKRATAVSALGDGVPPTLGRHPELPGPVAFLTDQAFLPTTPAVMRHITASRDATYHAWTQHSWARQQEQAPWDTQVSTGQAA